MTQTQIQSKVTKTSAFDGAAVDVAAITADWTLKLKVSSLTAAKKARFAFSDSVNSFTASLSGPSASLVGAINSEGVVKSWKKQDFPSLRIGITNGLLRASLAEIDGSASVDYEAWLEY